MPSVCVQSSRQESREEGETSPLDWILLQQWQMWRHFATPDNTWWALTQLKDSTLNCPSTKENSATEIESFPTDCTTGHSNRGGGEKGKAKGILGRGIQTGRGNPSFATFNRSAAKQQIWHVQLRVHQGIKEQTTQQGGTRIQCSNYVLSGEEGERKGSF